MEGLTPLYVYWLRAPKLDNVIVYVGCGKDVEARAQIIRHCFFQATATHGG